MLAKMDAHRDTQDDESRSKFDSWLVGGKGVGGGSCVEGSYQAEESEQISGCCRWGVLVLCKQQNVGIDAGICAPQVCVAGSMLSNVTGES